MNRYIIGLAIAIFLVGCVTTTQPPLQKGVLLKLTETSFVKLSEHSADYRTYYLRYTASDNQDVIALFIKIDGIDGVKGTIVDRHEIIVNKSPAYTWSEIEPKIESLVEEFEEEDEVSIKEKTGDKSKGI